MNATMAGEVHLVLTGDNLGGKLHHFVSMVDDIEAMGIEVVVEVTIRTNVLIPSPARQNGHVAVAEHQLEHKLEHKPVPAAKLVQEAEPSALVVPWGTYEQEVLALDQGARFATVAKPARLRLISLFGEALVHEVGTPTMAVWDRFKPLWMPTASGVMNSYNDSDMSWAQIAADWSEVGGD